MSAPTRQTGRGAPRVRLNVRVAAGVAEQLDALARREKRTQADIVETALLSLLSPDAVDKRDAIVTRRLDRQARQLETLQQELIVGTETLALFVRYFLIVTPALPESQQIAARAKGTERFAAFVDNLGRRLGEGKRLLGDLHLETRPGADEFRTSEEIGASTLETGHATI
jgi:hypothetical protein